MKRDRDLLDEYGFADVPEEVGETETGKVGDVPSPLPEVVGDPFAAGGLGQLGNAIEWETAKPAVTMTMQVGFLQTGTFWGTLYGKSLSHDTSPDLGDGPGRPLSVEGVENLEYPDEEE